MNSIIVYSVSSGKILRKVTCSYDHIAIQCQEDEEFYLNCPSDATHIINNVPVTIIPEPIQPTAEEIRQELVNAVQDVLDSTARTRNYDGILSLCSYATSTDATFAAEAQVGVVWRDACWRYCYQVMSDVQSGLREIPTPAEIVAELPEISFPN